LKLCRQDAELFADGIMARSRPVLIYMSNCTSFTNALTDITCLLCSAC